MAQVLEALQASKVYDELIDTLKDIVDQYRGNIVFEDNRKEGCISELVIYSECFTKKHLNLLFQYTDYPEIVSGGGTKLKLSILLPL